VVMMTIAYLANQFPADVEPYVSNEIDELRKRGIGVIAGSVRHVNVTQIESNKELAKAEILSLQPLQISVFLKAIVLTLRRWQNISDLLVRILLRGDESLRQRIKALLHTALGAYYASLLEHRKVNHIHVHHGYFGAWIAMVAARLLGVTYSLTLHGSDLLLGVPYLNTKLQNCSFCITISDYNRQHLLECFPEIDSPKILVCRLGVEVPEITIPQSKTEPQKKFTLLSVGRLHRVKNHAFLVLACARLGDLGIDFQCLIAGEGPERAPLESLICENHLEQSVTLLGQVNPREIDPLYQQADVVVLTSRSEGIPLVLMEAMARGKIVLAPAITGIPELVIPGKTGFLFVPSDIDDFVAKIVSIHHLSQSPGILGPLDWMRHAARVQALHNFNRKESVPRFADRFLECLDSNQEMQTSALQATSKRKPPARALPDEEFTQRLERLA
jgi:colanic acid/amylovoran biosynthesis glycosyltransferase